jgi:hypothetical protein
VLADPERRACLPRRYPCSCLAGVPPVRIGDSII